MKAPMYENAIDTLTVNAIKKILTAYFSNNIIESSRVPLLVFVTCQELIEIAIAERDRAAGCLLYKERRRMKRALARYPGKKLLSVKSAESDPYFRRLESVTRNILRGDFQLVVPKNRFQ